MVSKGLLTGAAIAFTAAAASSQSADAAITTIVFDFENPDVPQSVLIGDTYSSNGFTFSTVSAGFGLIDSDSGFFTGSQSLLPISQADVINLSSDNGFTFTPTSVDLTSFGGLSSELVFTGHFADGTTTSQLFITDSSDGLETLGFNDIFTDVVGLSWESTNGNQYSMDNLQIQATVPAPGAAAVMGLAGLAAARRRRP